MVRQQITEQKLYGHLPCKNRINYRFLTTETNLKALYMFRCLFTTYSVKLFVMNLQIFVYNRVFWKKEKQNPKNLPHIENESTF